MEHFRNDTFNDCRRTTADGEQTSSQNLLSGFGGKPKKKITHTQLLKLVQVMEQQDLH